MANQLELIDALVAEGREEFTFEDARAVLKVSPSATANTLRRLRNKGILDMVTRGHYAIRPFGSLGTAIAAESLSVAVGLAFSGREHRIAYLSAFGELGLLTH